MSSALPTLLDRKQLAAKLNVNLPTAERIMRGCPKVQVGRRVFVTEQSVVDYLKRVETTA